MANQYKLKDLGDTLSSAAFSINKRIQDDIVDLTFEEVKDLSEESKNLLIASKTLYELTAIEIAENAKDSLKQLESATAEINKAIKTIKTVQKVINITAKLVVLAGTVATGNYTSIPGNVKDIIEVIGESDED